MTRPRHFKNKPEGRSEGALFPEAPRSGPGINREPRVTATICIDRTSSLSTGWVVYLAALTRLLDECGKHPHTRTAAYVSVALCGSEFVATPYRPFTEAVLPELTPSGGSPGAMWLRSSVRHLRVEHQRMKGDAVTANKDIYLLISDFHFDDGEDAFNGAVEEYRTLEQECPQFNGFMVMAGEAPNQALAGRVSKKRPPVHLNSLRVEELFRWVSGVIQRASVSRPGQSVELPPPTWTLNDGAR